MEKWGRNLKVVIFPGLAGKTVPFIFCKNVQENVKKPIILTFFTLPQVYTSPPPKFLDES